MLDPVLPIAIYLLFGYLFKIIFQDNSKQLVDFIIYFSLPAIVFSKIYPLQLDTKILWLILIFMAIIFFNLFLSYCVGKMMRLNRVTLATFMIMATFGNTSFIGFSYIDAFYGQDYIVYGVIYDIFGSFLLLVSVGMIIITWGSGRKNSILNISGNLSPKVESFSPINGFVPMRFMWSFITIKSPALYSLFTLPAAFVMIRFLTPSFFITFIGKTTLLM